MAISGDEDLCDVLSDVEDGEPEPVTMKTTVEHHTSDQRYNELVAVLEQERAARIAAEASKSETQVSFNRLKSLVYEAIKKRDEAVAEKEQTLREKEKISSQLADVNRLKEEAAKENEETKFQLAKAVKERDEMAMDMENSRHLLVTGIEKMYGKVSGIKNFVGTGLPTTQKYGGLSAIAYGIIMRTNEIAEELLKKITMVEKSRDEAREQMEQRNYEIAIEVSQLEATISGLRDDVMKKTSFIENLEAILLEKERKTHEIEKLMEEKSCLMEKERVMASEYEAEFRSLEKKMDLHRQLTSDQLNLVYEIHGRLCSIVKVIDENQADSELSESMFLPQHIDVEENIRASLAGIEAISHITRIIAKKAQILVDDKVSNEKGLNNEICKLVEEKEHIGSLLRKVLSKHLEKEHGLKDGVLSSNHDIIHDKDTLAVDEGEMYNLASVVENVVKASELEIFDLRNMIKSLRAELNLLKENGEAQGKEIGHKMQQIKELEEKEKASNENINMLVMDMSAAEEEIIRWRLAAEQEAAAGKAIEQELASQISALRQELGDAKRAVSELQMKLKLKEETVGAAMAAREAAEKSLQLADLRASRLGNRVSELGREIEELENRVESGGRSGIRYICWPWHWLGLELMHPRRPEEQPDRHEMELSEPLL